MTSLLNNTQPNNSPSFNSGTNPVDRSLNQALGNQQQSFQQQGFVVSPIPGSDGDGLPSSAVPSMRYGTTTRNIIHWFVPEVGVINMYVNPQSIQYNYKKLITPERTKGGYVIQYWGEQLTELDLDGHTGSSGVEGLNVLYEIYRAEQYLFDPIALTMAADNSVSGLNDLVDSALGNLGGVGSTLSNATQGILGLDPASQNVMPRNVPSLAAIATGIELYYNGWVFRGFFNSFRVTESVDLLGMFRYNIGFTVTQRRGYRTNYLPWQRSAIDGPSNSQVIPYSFAGLSSQ